MSTEFWFCKIEIVLEVDGGEHYIELYIFKWFKIVNVMLCVLYHRFFKCTKIMTTAHFIGGVVLFRTSGTVLCSYLLALGCLVIKPHSLDKGLVCFDI